ncbi:hypothetical protein [Mycolicibacterium elephantis]|uniref:Uncharacterized protein n=1 Tax=Mycolicibacterium elephantis DSM 44368 TaxID=1335622 RepID=A0A439E0V0_9MYCO|nr:hypothetical protein [Mycolicibacterium elephantis]MCV7221603.1 hypothetical protein [Mycolicibacterium elephantis]RWA24042.1 hypothetical protein MELE44368_02185 [Mycolicibacterium elephantis DSM 44368]
MRREPWWISGLHIDTAGSYSYDGQLTAEQFSTACGHVGRNDAPKLLHDLWLAGAVDLSAYPGAVAEVWSLCEFPADAIDVWVDLFTEAGYTHNTAPAERPAHPVTVYRGCHPERRFGMSWTADHEQARWFAARNLGGGVGNVYKVTAQPGWLLAYIGDKVRGESEYVIDPAHLSDSVVART